jgi:pyruvate dehydrogenase E1 component alpha subunit
MLGANGVVAAGLPIAVGAAQAQKLSGRDAITCCFFGDGAINRGPFLEALNWARIFRLPVLFVCEDNRWSATTPSEPMTAGEGASARARALGIEALEVDGNDVVAVHAGAGDLVAQVRQGGGPRLLHARTYRVKGHVSVDLARYRDTAEVEAALRDDPIARARAAYLAAGGQARQVEILETEAAAEIAAAVRAADLAPWPDPSAAYSEVQTVGAGQWY